MLRDRQQGGVEKGRETVPDSIYIQHSRIGVSESVGEAREGSVLFLTTVDVFQIPPRGEN